MRVFLYLIVGVVLFYIDSIIGLLIPMHFGHFEFNFIPHLIFVVYIVDNDLSWLWNRINIRNSVWNRN